MRLHVCILMSSLVVSEIIKLSCWTCFSILSIGRVHYILVRPWNKFRVTIRLYFIVQFARKSFSSLRGRKHEAIQLLPILNSRKFRILNWTKMVFWWTLFSIFIHPSPELHPPSPTRGEGNKSYFWEFWKIK